MSQMAAEALTGALIGAGFAAGVWLAWATGLERRAQGLFGSAGLVLLLAACLWLDGWIAAAIPAYVLAAAAGGMIRARLR